ncbi:chymotrypsinogen A-like [Eriocheir sinensis]|uniref:chymotrypsinogen A-like n=1 Tax=Eriocheir sinensis TaxID=95602 RepID=UPI0021C5C329|nr:chymotrypsinogen A-like [Eriocheir sinensis]XP_050711549.1 chymotrypsinogen A-like [Eriocheir sinensis]XP_050711550.1 chymotrypsinogen A-like [Eriocheir sinensis]
MMYSLGLLLLLTAVQAQIRFPGEEPDGGGVEATDAELFEALDLTTRQNTNPGSGLPSCVTPGGETGTCQSFSSCRQFASLRSQLRKPSVLSFLRQRICGRFRNTVHLCCVDQTSSNQPAGSPTRSGGLNQIDCGEASGVRVVNGEDTSPGEWPWLAALGFRNGNTFRAGCGGTLITRKHVLTAAHCFAKPEFAPKVVRLGDYNLVRTDDTTTPPQDFNIKEHRDGGYNAVSQENDISIVILDGEARFNDFVQPACLPYNVPGDFTGKSLVVTGWGRTEHSNLQTPSIPLKALVPLKDRASCAQDYKRLPQIVIDRRTMCAGDGTTDACVGDSGGPLNYLDLTTGKYSVVGVVSFGVGCARKEFPGVYTDVRSFLGWIEQNVRQ